ncbi:MAG TPA: hypothetical protein VIK73_00195 [Limnochordales bacterium]
MTWLAVVALMVAAGIQPGQGGDEGPPPLPYVRGGSQWVYTSDRGLVRVRLDEEPGMVDGARRYRWEIRVAGAVMEEHLALRSSGLYTVDRAFAFLGRPLWRLAFDPPELTIALPLEVGRRWQWRNPVVSGSSRGWDEVEGVVEALEWVEVPAGRYEAYRIRLSRKDTWGSRMESLIWLDPEVGVVKADGLLRWPGLVGAVQGLLGLDRLRLSLREAHIEASHPPS